MRLGRAVPSASMIVGRALTSAMNIWMPASKIKGSPSSRLWLIFWMITGSCSMIRGRAVKIPFKSPVMIWRPACRSGVVNSGLVRAVTIVKII